MLKVPTCLGRHNEILIILYRSPGRDRGRALLKIRATIQPRPKTRPGLITGARVVASSSDSPPIQFGPWKARRFIGLHH